MLGWFIFSSRTVSTHTLYQSVHIRRVTSKYKAVLEENMLRFIQKPNTAEIEREMYVALLSYFKGEWESGALNNQIPFDKSCIINISTDKNDPKNLKVILDLILTECIESITIEINRNDYSII